MIILLIPSVLNHYKAPKEGPERAALAKAVLEGAIRREARCALITGSDFLWPTHVKFQFSLLSLHSSPPAPGVEEAGGGTERRSLLLKTRGRGVGGSFLGFYFLFLCIVKFGGSSHEFPPSSNQAGFLSWQRTFRVLTVDFYN